MLFWLRDSMLKIGLDAARFGFGFCDQSDFEGDWSIGFAILKLSQNRWMIISRTVWFKSDLRIKSMPSS